MTQMIVHGGVFHDWVAGTIPYWPVLTAGFRPHVIWATFGNTSNLVLAQKLARLGGIPWIIDVKDNWVAFLPKPLRRVVAWRFRDAAAMSANSLYHARIAEQWFNHRAEVIYSGIPEEMLSLASQPEHTGAFRVTITGSIRSCADLDSLLLGLSQWQHGLTPDECERVELLYAGSDEEIFRQAVARAQWRGRVQVRGYMPVLELARVCRAAAVNCYIWSPATFHHKLIELLACCRPIISYPSEHDESLDLARRHGGKLYPCADAAGVREILDGIWEEWLRGEAALAAPSEELRAFSWGAVAHQLEMFLGHALRASPE